MQTVTSKHVQTVLVTDPDTGGICEVEIRKVEGGPLVGLDAAFLDQTDNNAFSPYDKGVALMIPDDEIKIDPSAVHIPHCVTIDYADGLNVGVYHYPNKALAWRHVYEFLAERLDDIDMEDDDGISFATKIAHALDKGDVETALDWYRKIPDTLDIIDYAPIVTRTDTPLKGKNLRDLLAVHLEIRSP